MNPEIKFSILHPLQALRTIVVQSEVGLGWRDAPPPYTPSSTIENFPNLPVLEAAKILDGAKTEEEKRNHTNHIKITIHGWEQQVRQGGLEAAAALEELAGAAYDHPQARKAIQRIEKENIQIPLEEPQKMSSISDLLGLPRIIYHQKTPKLGNIPDHENL